MPDLSAFTDLGFLELSGDLSLPEQIYNAIWANLGPNFAQGGYTDAKVYAWSMGLANLLRATGRLEEQINPDTVLDLLPARELEHGIVVPAGATIAQRRAALRAVMRLPGGGTYGNVRQALSDLLGADFVAYRPPLTSEAVTYPVDPAVSGPGNWQLPGVRRFVGRLGAAVSTGLGVTPQAVTYTAFDGTVPPTATVLRVGEAVVVEPETDGITETVTVTAAGTSGGLPTFSANFRTPHTLGAILTTMPWPYWTSTQRMSLVVVHSPAAQNPEKRRQIDELMARMSRGVSTWQIVTDSSPHVVGPFVLDSSPLDVTTFLPMAV